MSFLGDEITTLKNKRQLVAKGYKRKADVEAERIAAYQADQEAQAARKANQNQIKALQVQAYEDTKRRKATAAVVQPIHVGKAPEANDVLDISVERLKELGQPIRLFGESEDEIILRLSTLESKKPEDEFLDPFHLTEGTVIPKARDFDTAKLTSSTGKSTLYSAISVLLRSKVNIWQQYILDPSTANTMVAIEQFNGSKSHIAHLLCRLEAQTLPDDILRNLTTICKALCEGNFQTANHTYLQMSIGKATWPVGVSTPTIHERALDVRLQGETDSAHILSDEQTRQWLQSLKRLITFCERNASSE